MVLSMAGGRHLICRVPGGVGFVCSPGSLDLLRRWQGFRLDCLREVLFCLIEALEHLSGCLVGETEGTVVYRVTSSVLA